MRIERIINKAKTLGINTGNGSRAEQIITIADALGIDEENLDLIENSLDEMLNDNEEFLDTDNYYEENNNYSKNVNKRNIKDKKEESENLKNASNERTQNKVETARDKINDLNSNKNKVEETEEKVEDASQKINTIKKVSQKGANAALSIGRATAKGASSLVTWIMANPYVAGAIVIVVLILLVVLMFVATDKDFTNGYFDGACNYNNTSVTYNSSIVNLKNFVLGSTYSYMINTEDSGQFSDSQIRALMIAIKTTVLAVGNYNSASKSVSINNEIEYIPVDEIPSDIKSDLEKNYEKIERFLYISDSYKDTITSLSYGSKLDLSPETIVKIKESSGSYEAILKNVYGGGESSSSSTNSTNFDASKPTIYIGDSRVAFMNVYGILNNSNSVYLGANGYCWFRYNTSYGKSCSPYWNSNTNDNSRLGGANAANKLMQSGQSYNIVIWLGVNDPSNVNDYFKVYKSLAENEWKNHTIYVAQVGPVKEEVYTATYYTKNADVDNFNSTMAGLISSSGLSNLIYLDLGINQDSINWSQSDGVHYGQSDSQMIFELFQNSAGFSGNRQIYDLGDYCAFYKNDGSCNTGWWWPIGEGEPVNGIYTQPPASWHTVINRGFTTSVTFTGRAHYGVDIPANYDDIVVAAKDGTVIYTYNGCTELANINSSCGGYGGNQVYIDHGDGTVTLYSHMGKDTIVVKEGDTVRQGQKIGLASATGSATGPHLHFGVKVNDQLVDPLQYIDATNTRPGGGECSGGTYSNDIQGACLALKDMGLSNNAIIGILINIDAETAAGGGTNTLEYCYHTNSCCPSIRSGYGYCDTGYLIGSFGDSHEAYTEGINSGNYPRYNFVNDKAGYGLIQWTDSGRKAGLYDYWVSETGGPGGNRGIDDLSIQLGYMIKEINSGSFTTVRNSIYSSTSSASDIGNDFCNYYERPDQSRVSCSTRVSTRLSKFTSYVNNNCN